MRHVATAHIGARAVAVVVAVLAIRNVGGSLLPAAWYVPVNLMVAALLVVIARRAGASWAELGLAPHRRMAGLRLGLTVAGIAVAVMTAGALLPLTQTFFEDQRVEVDAGGRELAYQTLVRIPFGTVLLEEVAFRGVLLGLLLRQVGTRAAVLVSSGLFGLWHVVPTMGAATTNDVVGPAQAGAVAAAVVITTVGGVLFCAVRLRSGHLLAPALLHLAFNDGGYLLSWWVQS